jgi:predicted MFS family arabinose efflux permease
LFARYSLIAGLAASAGAQAAALPAWIASALHVEMISAIRGMFCAYALLGLASYAIYRTLPRELGARSESAHAPLGSSKKQVYKLAAVFSIDSLGGGFAVQSLLALWLYQRFGLSIAQTATLFLWMGLLAAFSHLAASWLAARIGLVNTMVFTHLPANALCVLVPFMPTLELAMACLVVRSALGSMDVPTRVSYVMAVVSPAERPAAASVTNVPRSLASALSPALLDICLRFPALAGRW